MLTSPITRRIGAIEFSGNSTLWLPTNCFRFWWQVSVSAWIKTTQTFGGDDDPGFAGAGVIWGDLPGAAADVVPLALTGTKAAFFTGDPNSYSGNTLHSSTDVVGTGSYVHVAVTRNQITGEKKIYVNGDFEGASVGYLGALDALTDLGDLQIGGDYLHAYVGLLDDVQIYSGILSASEIGRALRRPGSTFLMSVVIANWTMPWINRASLITAETLPGFDKPTKRTMAWMQRRAVPSVMAKSPGLKRPWKGRVH
jgi:hypothetical protein